MEFFDRWARQIEAGDWLTSQPLHPYHHWHASVAAAYFERHLDDPLSRQFVAAPNREAADAVSRQLWTEWYGGTQFHQEPLYAYLIALTYRVLGANVRWVFAWQMILGVGTNVLIYALARRFMGDLVAVVTALLAVGCAPSLYYELILLRTTAVTFATLAIAWTAVWALERSSTRRWLLAGAVFGLGLLLQTLLAAMVAAAFCVLVVDERKQPRNLVRTVASAALGIAIVLAPVVIRNRIVGAPMLGLSSVGAVTFVASNAVDNVPDAGFFVSRYTADVMGRTNGSFLPAIVETLRTHASFGSFAHLMAGKVAALWQWYEIPNNTNFYFYRLHASILRVLPVTWTIVGPLGLLGLCLALPAFRRFFWLYLIVAASALPLIVFYVLSRFRAPLLVALLPFAAFAAVTIVDWLLSGNRLKAGLAIVAGTLLGVWMARPLPPGHPLIRIQDHSVTYEIYYRLRATEAENAGDWKRAANELADFLRLEPEEIRRVNAAAPPRDASVRSFVERYGRIHLRYADDLDKAGSHDEATRQRDRSRELLAMAAPGA
jgi:hypothetical protein